MNKPRIKTIRRPKGVAKNGNTKQPTKTVKSTASIPYLIHLVHTSNQSNLLATMACFEWDTATKLGRELPFLDMQLTEPAPKPVNKPEKEKPDNSWLFNIP